MIWFEVFWGFYLGLWGEWIGYFVFVDCLLLLIMFCYGLLCCFFCELLFLWYEVSFWRVLVRLVWEGLFVVGVGGCVRWRVGGELCCGEVDLLEEVGGWDCDCGWKNFVLEVVLWIEGCFGLVLYNVLLNLE